MNARQANLVDRARRRIQVLETLIDDLLDLAAGKADEPASFSSGPVSLSEVLHEVCARYESLAEDKGLSVQYSRLNDELIVCGDRKSWTGFLTT